MALVKGYAWPPSCSAPPPPTHFPFPTATGCAVPVGPGPSQRSPEEPWFKHLVTGMPFTKWLQFLRRRVLSYLLLEIEYHSFLNKCAMFLLYVEHIFP